MTIRKSTKYDIDGIMCLLGEARESMGRLGIDQWQYGYPSREIVKEDVKFDRSYVATDDDGNLCATFAIITGGEPTYRKIYGGNWLTDGTDYLVFHRIAVKMENRGTGLSDEIVCFLEKFASDHGFQSLRVDTHQGNKPMRKMLERNDFTYTGIIHLSSGEERVAYEKVLED